MAAALNPRQERFVAEYVVDRNATQAAIRAGYAPVSAHVHASRMLKDAKVAARVAEAQAAVAAKLEITQEWVLDRLVENANRAMQAEPVLDHEGEPTGEYRYDGNVANRALELVGKQIGMFVERREIGRPGAFAGLTPEQKQEKVKALARKLGMDRIGDTVGSA